MAISQMQKLSLILSKDDLDSLLLALQAQANVQIYDLSENEEWQAAFEASTLSQPLTEDNRQALVELQKRQEQVDFNITFRRFKRAKWLSSSFVELAEKFHKDQTSSMHVP